MTDKTEVYVMTKIARALTLDYLETQPLGKVEKLANMVRNLPVAFINEVKEDECQDSPTTSCQDKGCPALPAISNED